MTSTSLDDVDLGIRLVLHEARAQLGPGRELRDIGDGWLLHDRADAEPFWNRLMAPRWPEPAAAFDRRLDEVITLFATLGRLTHIRPAPAGDLPLDLVARLRRAGFDQVGEDRRMVLVDPSACLAIAAASLPVGIAVERRPALRAAADDRHSGHPSQAAGRPVPTGRAAGPRRRRLAGQGAGFVERLAGDADPGGRDDGWAGEVASILSAAFGVEPARRLALESDALAFVERGNGAVVLVRDEGRAVAVARATTTEGGTYLSSIATRPDDQGRGLGALATSVAVADALGRGDRLIHLAVETANDRATGLYARLGFRPVGGPVADLLLR